jgi:molybdopterin molybdotransferase
MITNKLHDDCFLHDKDRLSHEEAVALLQSRVRMVVGREEVALEDAMGRVLAGDVRAARPIPQHTNSAVDGYAFAFATYDATKGAVFDVVGRAAAGHPLTGPPVAGSSIRILTGALLPEGLDSVVMQEDVRRDEKDGMARVTIPPGLKRGANVRCAGEDVRAGEVVLSRGHTIRPQDLAALASAGIGRVDVHRALRVGVFSTGDEIVRPGEALKPGQVYDANAPMLAALIATTGASATDLGVMPDEAALVRARLREAAGRFDVLITSGGASRGEEDHVVRTLDEIGRRHLWQIAIKPGRPMSFGQIGDTIFIGLPGNPVAVFVCFLLYAWPMLVALSGAPWPEPRRLRLKSAFAVPGKKTGRREYWRGMLKDGPEGLLVDKFARDGSGLITSLREADGLIEADEGLGAVAAGDEVTFIPLASYGIGRL